MWGTYAVLIKLKDETNDYFHLFKLLSIVFLISQLVARYITWWKIYITLSQSPECDLTNIPQSKDIYCIRVNKLDNIRIEKSVKWEFVHFFLNNALIHYNSIV